MAVCVRNDLGDPPGHLTLPPVATYANEASPCAIWPATTAWIVKLSLATLMHSIIAQVENSLAHNWTV